MAIINYDIKAFYDSTFDVKDINKVIPKVDVDLLKDRKHIHEYTSYYLGAPNQERYVAELDLVRRLVFYQYKNGIKDLVYKEKFAIYDMGSWKDIRDNLTEDYFTYSFRKLYLLSLHDLVPYRVYKKIYDENDPNKVKKFNGYSKSLDQEKEVTLYNFYNPDIYSYFSIYFSKFIAFKVARTIIMEFIKCPRTLVNPELIGVGVNINFDCADVYLEKISKYKLPYEVSIKDDDHYYFFQEYNYNFTRKWEKNIYLLVFNELKDIFKGTPLFDIKTELKPGVTHDGNEYVTCLLLLNFKNGTSLSIVINLMSSYILTKSQINHPHNIKLNGGPLNTYESLKANGIVLDTQRFGINIYNDIFAEASRWKDKPELEIYKNYLEDTYRAEAEIFDISNSFFDKFTYKNILNLYQSHLELHLNDKPFDIYKFEKRKEREFYMDFTKNINELD